MLINANYLVLLHLLVLYRFINSKQTKSAISSDEYQPDDYEQEDEFSDYDYGEELRDEQDDEDDLIGSMSQTGQNGEDEDLDRINAEIQSQADKLKLLTEHEPASQEIIEQTDLAIDRPMLGTRQVDERRYLANQPGSTYGTNRDQRAEANEESYGQNANPQEDVQQGNRMNSQEERSDEPRRSNATLPSSNLPKFGKSGAPFHNNIFVIQGRCRKKWKSRRRRKTVPAFNPSDVRSGKKPKKKKSRRSPDQHREKRKRKRPPKKVIVIEEDNFVPAYKERKSYASREIEI